MKTRHVAHLTTPPVPPRDQYIYIYIYMYCIYLAQLFFLRMFGVTIVPKRHTVKSRRMTQHHSTTLACTLMMMYVMKCFFDGDNSGAQGMYKRKHTQINGSRCSTAVAAGSVTAAVVPRFACASKDRVTTQPEGTARSVPVVPS